jgi:hypothetical protein
MIMLHRFKLHRLFPILLLTGFILPAQAAEPTPAHQTAQQQPTIEDIYQACTQNRAETLPNPFVDVSPQDWAYKAVLTMHYCGAFRQAAPKRLFEQPSSSPSQAVLPIVPQR